MRGQYLPTIPNQTTTFLTFSAQSQLKCTTSIQQQTIIEDELLIAHQEITKTFAKALIFNLYIPANPRR